MYPISDINKINSILEEYDNATIEVVMFGLTHSRLLLKLSKNKYKTLYILAGCCISFSGAFLSDGMNLIFEIKKRKPDTGGFNEYCLKDKELKYNIITNNTIYVISQEMGESLLSRSGDFLGCFSESYRNQL